jgi:hypothetical protein
MPRGTSVSLLGLLVLAGAVAAAAVVWAVASPGRRSASDDPLLGRLQRLESSVAALSERIDALAEGSSAAAHSASSEPSRSSAAPGGDLADRVELLDTRLTLLQRSVDDELARNAVSVGVLQRRLDGGAGLDEADRERIRQEVVEENRLAFQRRLQELQTANTDARTKWIADVSGDLGLTSAQRDEVVRVYESQAERWAKIFEKIQLEAMSPKDSTAEFRALRLETDQKLRSFLSADQVERFRSLEAQKFGRAEAR